MNDAVSKIETRDVRDSFGIPAVLILIGKRGGCAEAASVGGLFHFRSLPNQSRRLANKHIPPIDPSKVPPIPGRNSRGGGNKAPPIRPPSKKLPTSPKHQSAILRTLPSIY